MLEEFFIVIVCLWPRGR